MGSIYCLTFITVALRFTERGDKGGKVEQQILHNFDGEKDSSRVYEGGTINERGILNFDL